MKGAINPRKGMSEKRKPICPLLSPNSARKSGKTEPKKVNWTKKVLLTKVAMLQGMPRSFSIVVGSDAMRKCFVIHKG